MCVFFFFFALRPPPTHRPSAHSRPRVHATHTHQASLCAAALQPLLVEDQRCARKTSAAAYRRPPFRTLRSGTTLSRGPLPSKCVPHQTALTGDAFQCLGRQKLTSRRAAVASRTKRTKKTFALHLSPPLLSHQARCHTPHCLGACSMPTAFSMKACSSASGSRRSRRPLLEKWPAPISTLTITGPRSAAPDSSLTRETHFTGSQ